MPDKPEVMTYDPKKITSISAGRVDTGLSEDGILTVTYNEDRVTPSVGAKGDVTYSENANNSGNIAITFMSTSSSLAHYRDLCARRVPFRYSLSDANDYDAIHINEENCRVLKMPDMPRTNEQTTVTVNIFVPDLNVR